MRATTPKANKIRMDQSFLAMQPTLRSFSLIRSWRRRWPNLLLFGVIILIAQPRRDKQQIIVHLIPREDLAELRDVQPFAEMADQVLQGPNILGGYVPHQVAERPLLL